MRETVRPLGIELEWPEDAEDAKPAKGDAEGAKPKKKRRSKTSVEDSPVKHVHFSNFIIQ